MSSAWVRAWVGLGGNLGDPGAQFQAVHAALSQQPKVRALRGSGWWRSAPLDAQGPEFVNAVLTFDTQWTAQELLLVLQALETTAGRERPFRHAPRTLDLDVLLWGDLVSRDPQLTLPHPRMHERAFVLRPALELDPQLHLPGRGLARQCLDSVSDQVLERWQDWPELLRKSAT